MVSGLLTQTRARGCGVVRAFTPADVPVLITAGWRCARLRRSLRARVHLIAQTLHDLPGSPDVSFAETDAQGGCDCKKASVQVAVAPLALCRELHQLRTQVFRIVDEVHEPFGRKLVRQPLHALAAGRSHLRDLRHGQGTKPREAPHDAKRTAASAGDPPGFLTDGPYPEEELRHVQHLREETMVNPAGPQRPALVVISVLALALASCARIPRQRTPTTPCCRSEVGGAGHRPWALASSGPILCCRSRRRR